MVENRDGPYDPHNFYKGNINVQRLSDYDDNQMQVDQNSYQPAGSDIEMEGEEIKEEESVAYNLKYVVLESATGHPFEAVIYEPLLDSIKLTNKTITKPIKTEKEFD